MLGRMGSPSLISGSSDDIGALQYLELVVAIQGSKDAADADPKSVSADDRYWHQAAVPA